MGQRSKTPRKYQGEIGRPPLSMVPWRNFFLKELCNLGPCRCLIILVLLTSFQSLAATESNLMTLLSEPLSEKEIKSCFQLLRSTAAMARCEVHPPDVAGCQKFYDEFWEQGPEVRFVNKHEDMLKLLQKVYGPRLIALFPWASTGGAVGGYLGYVYESKIAQAAEAKAKEVAKRQMKELLKRSIVAALNKVAIASKFSSPVLAFGGWSAGLFISGSSIYGLAFPEDDNKCLEYKMLDHRLKRCTRQSPYGDPNPYPCLGEGGKKLTKDEMSLEVEAALNSCVEGFHENFYGAFSHEGRQARRLPESYLRTHLKVPRNAIASRIACTANQNVMDQFKKKISKLVSCVQQNQQKFVTIGGRKYLAQGGPQGKLMQIGVPGLQTRLDLSTGRYETRSGAHQQWLPLNSKASQKGREWFPLGAIPYIKDKITNCDSVDGPLLEPEPQGHSTEP